MPRCCSRALNLQAHSDVLSRDGAAPGRAHIVNEENSCECDSAEVLPGPRGLRAVTGEPIVDFASRSMVMQPTTTRGNNYIITCVDYLTKNVEARAVPNTESQTVPDQEVRHCLSFCIGHSPCLNILSQVVNTSDDVVVASVGGGLQWSNQVTSYFVVHCFDGYRVELLRLFEAECCLDCC